MTMYARLWTGIIVTIAALGYCVLAAIDRPTACSIIGTTVLVACPAALIINALRGRGAPKHER